MELLQISFSFLWRIQPHHFLQVDGCVGLPNVFYDVYLTTFKKEKEESDVTIMVD